MILDPTPPPFLEGHPPWSTEDIEFVCFRNLKHVEARLVEHPGRPYKEQLESIEAIRRLFNKTTASFNATIQQFHNEALFNDLFRRPRNNDRWALEEKVREYLYVFTTCAMTLVDQTRVLSKLFNIPNYNAKIEAAFATNPMHRFIQELRVDVVHVTFHKPSQRLIISSPENRVTTFLLHSQQLPRAKKYNAEAKKYLEQHPQGVNLGELVRLYTVQVNQFHEWLRKAIEVEVGTHISDYDRTCRIVRAVGSRTWWNLLLTQFVIAGKRNPYTYLDQHLTVEKLEEIRSLPHASQQQVDRIIELVDEDGACDDGLRAVIYQAFEVKRA